MHTEIRVHVERGNTVESTHRGLAAVVNINGDVVAHAGNTEQNVFARSTLKPLQAIPLLLHGGAERFGLEDRELSVICSSHGGQPFHLRAVAAILRKIGLDETFLACGAHDPWNTEASEALKRRNEKPTPLHNNCSGKHAGMLALNRLLGARTETYYRMDHPVQQRMKETVSRMCGLDPDRLLTGIDGCGVPVFGMPIRNLALAMARFGSPDELPSDWKTSCRRIFDAMTAFPEYVAGDGRYETELMRVTGKRILAKSGAEGTFVLSVPEKGWGIAVKIEDGASRALFPAVTEILAQTGLLDEKGAAQLEQWRIPQLRNWNGTTVGQIRPDLQLFRPSD